MILGTFFADLLILDERKILKFDSDNGEKLENDILFIFWLRFV